MRIDIILENNQPKEFNKLRNHRKKKRKRKTKKKKEEINYKELMEDAPVYIKKHGAFRQVR